MLSVLKPRSIFDFAVGLLLAATVTTALAQSCTNLCLKQVSCPGGGTTSISGTVYAPNNTDPLPNVVVYVPNASVSAFTPGVQCVTSAQPVSGSPLVGTTTSTTTPGTYKLTNMPVGTNIPVVIQAGRWRRQYTVTTTACTNTTLNMNFPTTHAQGDIPLIAVATGSIDATECVLRKIGIADSEFTDPSGTGRVRFYTGTHSAGAEIDAATPNETQLEGSVLGTSDLNNYDMVMLPCQGGISSSISNASYLNLLNYANSGGRIFATHWSEAWLNNNGSLGAPGTGSLTSPFVGVANWVSEISVGSNIPGTVNTTFADGAAAANWLQDVGATSTYGQLPSLNNVFEDVSTVIPPTQSWITINSAKDNYPVVQFTFDTPLGASSSAQCGRVMYNDYHVEPPVSSTNKLPFPTECDTASMTAQEKLLEYGLFDLSTFITPQGTPTATLALSASPTHFTAGDTADTLNIQVTNTSTNSPSNPSLTMTLTLPTGMTATAMSDSSGGGWLCNAGTLTCTRITGMDANTSDNIAVTVSTALGTAPGNVTISATLSGGGLAASVPASLTMFLYGAAVISWTPTSPITYPAPLTSAQLDATAVPSAGTWVYSPAAGTVLNVGTQTLNAIFTPTDTVDYPNPAAATAQLVVNQGAQTISFSLVSPVTYGVAPITLSATGGASGNTVTFTVTSGPATISGNTLTITGAGSVVVTANQAGNSNYLAATPVSQTLIVNQAAQTISFTLASPVTYGVPPITLNGTASSGLAVSYTVTGPATVSGSTLTITGAGSVVVTASQAGNTNYIAATPVSQTLAVNPATQTINFTLASPVTYGVSPITLNGTASSGLAVSYTATGPATLSGSTLTITGAGTVVVTALQAGNTNYTAATPVSQTLAVNPALQTINFTLPSPVTYGVSPITLNATASSGLAVSYTATGPATLSGSTLTITGAGTVVVTALQAGNANYTAATPVIQTLVVNPEQQTISFALSSPVTFGVAPITLSATGGGSGNPVAFAVTSGPATLSGSTLTITGAGTVVVTATQAGNANYATATPVSQTLIVNQEVQTITFTLASPVTYGVPPITLSATASSGLAVSFTVTSGPATVSGNTLTITGGGTVVVTATQAGNTNYAAATPVGQTLLVNPAMQTIAFAQPTSPVTYGVAPMTLSATASSGLAVTFSVKSGSATASGNTLTITGAGTVVVAADQTGNASYTAATEVTRTILVNPAASATTLTGTPTALFVKNPMTFTATVAPGSGATTTPTGTVTFFINGNAWGTSPLINGVAVFTNTYTIPSGITVTATYNGDSGFNASTSTAVGATLSDFSVTGGAGFAQPQVVVHGDTVSYIFTVAPVNAANGYPTPITLAADGYPFGSTLTWSQTTLAAGSGAATITLTIQTATYPSGPVARNQQRTTAVLACFMLGGLLVPIGWRMRRKPVRLLAAIVLLAASAGALTSVTGCGSGWDHENFFVVISGVSGQDAHYLTTPELTVH